MSLPRYTRIRSQSEKKRRQLAAEGKRPDATLEPGRRHRRCYDHLRDEEYKAWVREQRCLLALRPGHRCGRSEFAHLESEGRGGGDYGNGVPLCSMAHRRSPKSLHMLGPDSFEREWGVDLHAEAERLVARYERERPS